MTRDPRKPTTTDEELLEAESLTIVSELDDAARIARIDGELRDGFEALAHIGKAVSFFGSARTPPDDPAYVAARSLARVALAVQTAQQLPQPHRTPTLSQAPPQAA